jgi:hypothetical protein
MALNITLDNWYLDFEGVDKLDEVKQEIIHNYYKDMLYAFEENRPTMGYSLFLTLQKNGYLKNIRGEKIEELLKDD